MKMLIASAVVPLIVGPLTFVVMQGLKALSATVEALPAVAKRIAVVAIAVALTALGTWAGVDFQCDQTGTVNCLSTIDKDALKAVVGAVVAFVLHFAKQQSAKPQGTN